ncbi:hypothetical protein [Petrachloros mirabilis]
MKRMSALVLLLLLVMNPTTESVSSAAETSKPKEDKGTTLEGLGQGLKMAAQNVEKEIPKIGSAIGAAFKKITGAGSKNKSDQEPPREKK